MIQVGRGVLSYRRINSRLTKNIYRDFGVHGRESGNINRVSWDNDCQIKVHEGPRYRRGFQTEVCKVEGTLEDDGEQGPRESLQWYF